MKLSQSSVTILETCPRLFQHRVLEQLDVPQLGDQWERMLLGSQFHQLMQQRAQGLPIEAIVMGDRDLQRWFKAVEKYEAELFPEGLTAAGRRAIDGSIELVWADSEHVRTLDWMGHTIVGVYDYLVLYPESAQILDWKTYPKPIDTRRIEQTWQTRLYPFLLAQTSDYAPNSIEMSYWFFQGEERSTQESTQGFQGYDRPQMLRLSYSVEQYQSTAEALTVILKDLNRWLQAYEQQGISFPQTEMRSVCETCAFAVRCDHFRSIQDSPMRSDVKSDDQMLNLLTWDGVGEILL